MKIASIVGARPQFIKLFPLSREIRKEHEEVIIHTGQHYDENLSEIFFDQLEIPDPDHNLGVGSGTHGRMTGEILIRLEKVLIEEEPDLVIVFGDTNSTLAGALASVKLHIPTAHVEAGLRSFNRRMPEEINRVATDHLSDILFSPTATGTANLRNEGLVENVFTVGDTMLDAFLEIQPVVERYANIVQELDLESGGFQLLTLHRQENTDSIENMRAIFDSIIRSGRKVIFPAHPRAVKYLSSYGILDRIETSNIKLIPPVGYVDFLSLLVHAEKVLTDSGGVQKEAYFAHTPCITLREETEWIETVNDGWNVLVNTDEQRIIDSIRHFSPHGPVRLSSFGDGNAARSIVQVLSDLLRQS